MTDWLRLWHGAPTDPKWRTVARRAGVRPGDVWAVASVLMDRASQASDRGSVAGYDSEVIADALGFEADEVDRIIAALIDKGVVADGRLASWEKYQPKRERENDNSGQRVQAFRERQSHVTPCNAIDDHETPRGEEKREEIEQEPSSSNKPSDPDTPAARSPRFAFEGKTIKLTPKDHSQWREAFPHLSLNAELLALDEWAGQQGKWFPAVSAALAKREREAMAAIERARAAEAARATGPPTPRMDPRI